MMRFPLGARRCIATRPCSSAGRRFSSSLASPVSCEMQSPPLCREKDSSLLREKKLGVVAHFFMAPELTKRVQSLQEEWPHIDICVDARAMGESAVKMARSGEVDGIACMGVDVLSESIRASIECAGLGVPVFRLTEGPIGLSLAESQSVGHLFEAPLCKSTLEYVLSNFDYHRRGVCVVSHTIDASMQGQPLLEMSDWDKLLKLATRMEGRWERRRNAGLGARCPNPHLMGYSVAASFVSRADGLGWDPRHLNYLMDEQVSRDCDVSQIVA